MTDCGRFLEALQMPVNVHGGTGAPDYGDYPFAMLLLHKRGHLLLPATLCPFRPGRRLRAVSAAEVRHYRDPVLVGTRKLLKDLDGTIDRIRKTGQTGEIRYGDEHKLDHLASEYFAQNVWMGVSQAPSTRRRRSAGTNRR